MCTGIFLYDVLLAPHALVEKRKKKGIALKCIDN
jgi:hypothetical protein